MSASLLDEEQEPAKGARAQAPIAIVGMAGVFPGAADVARFWERIVGKADAAEVVPRERWGVDPASVVQAASEPDKAFHRRACIIRDFALDPEGLDLAPGLLDALDPLYHLVLHAGREALRAVSPNPDTGQPPLNTTGVILAAIALPTDSTAAVSRQVFAASLKETLLGQPSGPRGRDGGISSLASLGARVTGFPAALLATALGLGGSTFTLDAACASSLFAVKLACDELRAGRSDLMLAGGVSRPDNLYTQIGFSQLRALSPSGRCAPFDQGADGLMVGEGCGILALKRLHDAQRDGDRILGLITGIGLSNDMGGNLLAPDAEGQLRAMTRAYRSAGWSPSDVDLIECHGAGTPVGDAVELESLKRLRAMGQAPDTPCAIGSVKSMIGHLLTAAGTAGLIKVLLALRHGLLPPSNGYESPAKGSPLAEGGPLRVQTETAPWPRRAPGVPRRAAVSAFGFGGTNAHLLIEEYQEAAPTACQAQIIRQPAAPIAVVGMAAAAGPLQDLRRIQEAVFNGRPAFIQRPAHRWKGMRPVVSADSGGIGQWGAYMDEISVDIGRFHIPPNEIPSIIPQHLLMLMTAADALEDAGMGPREDREAMGAVIGMNFDMEAANYHLRWTADQVAAPLCKDRFPDDAAWAAWVRKLKEACGPPLTASGTLGALGSMVASRIAKTFRFGAPSFVVSCEEASGVKALEVAVRALQLGEAEAMLVGAVDMAGDVRQVSLTAALLRHATGGQLTAFDRDAAGTLTGEGAVALVLKRLDQARADGDRIYAVIDGIGGATAASDPTGPSSEGFQCALARCLADAGRNTATGLSGIDLIHLPGTGDPARDKAEAAALGACQGACGSPAALGTLTPVIGHAGAAAGLFSVAGACLSLYHEILPPTGTFVRPADGMFSPERFFFPGFPQYWSRNREDGPRRALSCVLTRDGSASHVHLCGAPEGSKILEPEQHPPLGAADLGLFAVHGDHPEGLLSGLDALAAMLSAAQLAPDAPVAPLATKWYRRHRPETAKGCAVALIAGSAGELSRHLGEARQAVQSASPRMPGRQGGIAYTPSPLGNGGEIAFVFPGSGNHYPGMGRRVGVLWPALLRSMDNRTARLKDQMLPRFYVPQRLSWEKGWEIQAQEALGADPLRMIFGQVIHGGLMSDLIRRFGIAPTAVIGYSLGETAGNFALGLWPDRGEMLKRMQDTDLFSTQLAGPCKAARRAWGIAADAPFTWAVAVVNRPAKTVRAALTAFPLTRLLIVNTPEECVIGGHRPEVQAAIRHLSCEGIFIEGVVTVHCDALTPVAEAYRLLHHFPVTPPPGIRFYSCAAGGCYHPTAESAAESILNQARHGFDFPQTIDAAYADGVRIFLEMGPHNSCSRMIRRILADRPHVAVSTGSRGEDELMGLLKFLATLISEGIPLDLSPLFVEEAEPPALSRRRQNTTAPVRRRAVGDLIKPPALPQPQARPAGKPVAPPTPTPSPPPVTAAPPSPPAPFSDLAAAFEAQSAATAEAHDKFLALSNELTQGFAETFDFQMRLLAAKGMDPGAIPEAPAPEAPADPVAFSREMCMAFAVGSAERVLGPAFAALDTYPARVRLPDEPLMLVDRILSIEAEKGVLGPGKIVTEHDVLPGAWYLDGDRAPVCISVEAGQADLFLCAYMGIDLVVKGQRTYRLLDATVDFLRPLPRPGETIRYEIEIERFARQGDTYLFFFHFDGTIDGAPLIRMRNGCAGFFTTEEVRNSGGILFTAEERKPTPGKTPADWRFPVPMEKAAYDEAALDALRAGNPAACFGPRFAGKIISAAGRLPGGRMHLIDRILEIDPAGGRYGLGRIRAEADIRPDKWFLTCHFVDDKVMPGTLMYECCAHTLRVFLQRLGWISQGDEARYEPVIGVKSRLKCRGPVTPETQHVVYEIEIKELGYNPEPYAIADALMYGDGHRIVWFQDMGMRLTGVTRADIEALWAQDPPAAPKPSAPVFDETQILAFSQGKPSEAFGAPYRPFDAERFIARLPRPPFSLMSRVTQAEPRPWELKPGGWITAEYDVPADAWYLAANRTPTLPVSILMEIALQPCGWLAAYAGSALTSEKDLRFRNLGGKAELLADVSPGGATLSTRARMTSVSAAGEMIIEHFDFEVSHGGSVFYRGSTNFGFFTAPALARQVGLGQPPPLATADAASPSEAIELPPLPPLTPTDGTDADCLQDRPLEMPGKALLMLDRITRFDPAGGPQGLGYLSGEKSVDPDEWFFTAHFYQDPVCPGSLGIESFMQLLRYYALQRWPHLKATHRATLLAPSTHQWTYRGQVTPANRLVTVEAAITALQEGDSPCATAMGYLRVDGLPIYKMENFAIRLAPVP